MRVNERYAIMPWGKYKGRFLKEIPTEYLEWCVQNYDDGVAQWLLDELKRRPEWVKTIKK